ncbi:hypothetical protein F8388_019115 [Cannabis sativa]|uniref:Uncharacterized protein n=1 Tax=Cannabis sativa TaxID=3483 RepID=A0A7J6FCQ3_CANSA|nr:hypothetical protein F8388_019115 [Cannabis sativa]
MGVIDLVLVEAIRVKEVLRWLKETGREDMVVESDSFVEGGIASIVAGASTHPLDLIKVRMQLHGEPTLTPPINPNPSLLFRPAMPGNISAVHSIHLMDPPPRVGPVSIGVNIVRSEGVAALFSGVSATILRQTLYSATRMGLYEVLKQKWTDPQTGNFTLPKKIAAGLVAGGVGAAVGNPADVAMVRMQADGRLPISERRNYKSVVDAISQMSKSEGLASYDEIKETILKKGLMNDGIGTHVAASFAAGFLAAVASNPVDVIKTRVMNMRVESGAGPPYSGALDCAVKTVRAEGVMALYKGFIPTISRQGPFTVVLFVTLEQIRKVLKDF